MRIIFDKLINSFNHKIKLFSFFSFCCALNVKLQKFQICELTLKALVEKLKKEVAHHTLE